VVLDPHPFHADPDTGFQILADPYPDPGFEIFVDPNSGLDFFLQKLVFLREKKGL